MFYIFVQVIVLHIVIADQTQNVTPKPIALTDELCGGTGDLVYRFSKRELAAPFKRSKENGAKHNCTAAQPKIKQHQSRGHHF